MKGKRFSEEKKIAVLQEYKAGIPMKEICRKHGVSDGTVYAWKAKLGDMDVSDARKLKALEEENRKLKRIVADQALDIVVLKDINSKKW
jgi:putative transposase